LKLAYLMYLAKRDEGSACGGDTHTIAISKCGGFTFVDETEMQKAERIAEELDDIIKKGLRQVTSLSPPDFHQAFSEKLKAVADSYSNLDFPSLKDLDRKFWKEKK